MGQALYRKYRSRSFDEVVGQEHITKTLQNSLKSGRISHAYLFTGPRGVGKTSVARILAHEVNKIPYSDESVHLDIIEIDAASNRRIDEIRDLREKVHTTPALAKYKVYIIDEVHMLTREAANALLKTLEEPPAHCIFILATTEGHKLPETIVSRTQRFEFKPVGPKQTAQHLSHIAKSEKINVSPEALDLLAQHGDGSFRDSIGMLDQLASVSGSITEDGVRAVLGLPPADSIDRLVQHITAGDAAQSLQNLDDLRENGVAAAAVSQLLGKCLRELLMQTPSSSWLIPLLKQLVIVPASVRPQDQLEIAILEACETNRLGSNTQLPPIRTVVASSTSEARGVIPTATTPKQNKKTTRFSLDVWPQVIDAVRKEAPALYTALRLAKPRYDNDKLVLCFQFALHQKKVNQSSHKQLIGRIVDQISGSKMTVECIVDKETFSSPGDDLEDNIPAQSDGSLHTISNIFGDAKVLES